jgi:hypothetical protein
MSAKSLREPYSSSAEALKKYGLRLPDLSVNSPTLKAPESRASFKNLF